MTTPQGIEPEHTLLTAVARLDHLRTRESLAGFGSDAEALDKAETLELLALTEVVARKAAYGRQLTVRAAREAGASWTQIGAALGMSKQAAWEAHTRWIDAQAEVFGEPGRIGFDEEDLAAARALAGSRTRAEQGIDASRTRHGRGLTRASPTAEPRIGEGWTVHRNGAP